MRSFPIIGAALLTAACGPVNPPGDIPAARPPAGKCTAGPAQELIGETATSETGARALSLTGSARLRWGPPDSTFTMDYREDRVNVFYDRAMNDHQGHLRMSGRRRAFTGSPYEKRFGFARAMRVGDRILVAGTGPVEDDGTTTPGDAAAQAERCLNLILRAVEELGGSAADIVRTRMLLTDPADQDAVGAVHARFFAAASPAATMAGVAWLCRPEWKVEIEAEAVVG